MGTILGRPLFGLLDWTASRYPRTAYIQVEIVRYLRVNISVDVVVILAFTSLKNVHKDARSQRQGVSTMECYPRDLFLLFVTLLRRSCLFDVSVDRNAPFKRFFARTFVFRNLVVLAFKRFHRSFKKDHKKVYSKQKLVWEYNVFFYV